MPVQTEARGSRQRGTASRNETGVLEHDYRQLGPVLGSPSTDSSHGVVTACLKFTRQDCLTKVTYDRFIPILGQSANGLVVVAVRMLRSESIGIDISGWTCIEPLDTGPTTGNGVFCKPSTTITRSASHESSKVVLRDVGRWFYKFICQKAWSLRPSRILAVEKMIVDAEVCIHGSYVFLEQDISYKFLQLIGEATLLGKWRSARFRGHESNSSTPRSDNQWGLQVK